MLGPRTSGLAQAQAMGIPTASPESLVEKRWQEGLERTKTYFADSLNAPYVSDIELEFDAAKTVQARLSGKLNERVVFINPSFAEKFKNSLSFVLGHELAHDVFNHTKPEHNAKMDSLYQIGDGLAVDALSRIREEFCDSLALAASSKESAILYFDGQKLQEHQEVMQILLRVIPELSSIELKGDSLIQIQVPIKEKFWEKGNLAQDESVLSAFHLLAQRHADKMIDKNISFSEVPLNEVVEQITLFISEQEIGTGTHSSFRGRKESTIGRQ